MYIYLLERHLMDIEAPMPQSEALVWALRHMCLTVMHVYDNNVLVKQSLRVRHVYSTYWKGCFTARHPCIENWMRKNHNKLEYMVFVVKIWFTHLLSQKLQFTHFRDTFLPKCICQGMSPSSDTLKYSTVNYSTQQYSMEQYSNVQYSNVQ